MGVRNVTVEGYNVALHGLMPELEQAAIKGMRSTSRAGVAVMVESIEESGAVNTGHLKKSTSSHNVEKGAELVVDAPYAMAVNYGSRPHMMPIQPLIDWALRKFKVDEEEAKEIAYAVRRKIATKGTKPTMFRELAIEQIIDDILPRELASEFKKAKV